MSSVARDPSGSFGQDSLTAKVREAVVSQPAARKSFGFSLTHASVAERIVAPILGLYLGWAVGRIPEVFPALAIPRLPMILLLIFIALLAIAVPPAGWVAAWRASVPLRCVSVLFGLAWLTAPLGIWIGGSVQFITDRYLIAVVIFLACLFFLRDRRAMRGALTGYVLCITAIAIYTLVTYDPNAPVYDDAGNLLDLAEVSIYQRRINVGVSLDPNDWGAVLVTTIPLALYLSYGSLIRRALWGTAAIALMAAVVPTASRGSMVGLVAALATLIAVGASGWRRGLLLGLTAVGGLAFSMMATEGQLTRFFDFGGDDYNLTNEGRWYFWRQGFVWAIKRPWGYGIANYPTYFDWLNGIPRAAHSSWVQYLVELGWLGLGTFVLLAVTLWRGNRDLRRLALVRKGQGEKSAEGEAVLAGHMLALLVGTLVTGSFLSNAYYPLMYMALGIAGASLLGSHDLAVAASSTPVAPSTPAAAAERGVVRLRRAARAPR